AAPADHGGSAWHGSGLYLFAAVSIAAHRARKRVEGTARAQSMPAADTAEDILQRINRLGPGTGECRKGVTRGLDPRVHHLRKTFLRRAMDGRVKPGHDAGRTR